MEMFRAWMLKISWKRMQPWITISNFWKKAKMVVLIKCATMAERRLNRWIYGIWRLVSDLKVIRLA